MTSKTIHLPLMNGLLYIGDALTFDPPRIDAAKRFWTTPHCVAISCRPDCDGETTLIIGTTDEIGQRVDWRFDGRIKTPSRRIGVRVVPGDTVLEMPVAHADTRIRIWTKPYRDTDTVIVGLE